MISTDAALPAPDRRVDDRFVTIFRAGKLTKDGEERLCMLRNISATGAMLHHDGRLAVGDAITLDLRLDERLPGRVAWVDGDRCGVRFDVAVDLGRLLARHASEGLRPRPPRLRLRTPAQARLQDALHDVVLRDVSQNGACFTYDERIMPREPELRLILPGFGDYRALVRWRRGGFAGVAFVSTLPMWPLNEWVRTRRN